MAEFDKWIDGIRPEESVGRAAEYSLGVRLAAIEHFLPLAADQSGFNVEYVHQLRVFTRRSMAALKLYGKLARKKDVRWFVKTLRKVRQAAGSARDLDVLAESHLQEVGKGAREFLDDVRARRAAAQHPIQSVHEKLIENGTFRRHVDQLTGSLGRRQTARQTFGPWARSRLKKCSKQFFRASPVQRRDLERLHQFRIRGKELRYAMELLAPAFPVYLRTDIYPIVEDLQERLGKINDHVIAGARFGSWATETKRKREAAHVRKLLKQEQKLLEKRLQEFDDWWTPQFEDGLKESLRRLIGSQPPNWSDRVVES